jgi:hypothetical protein
MCQYTAQHLQLQAHTTQDHEETVQNLVVYVKSHNFHCYVRYLTAYDLFSFWRALQGVQAPRKVSLGPWSGKAF